MRFQGLSVSKHFITRMYLGGVLRVFLSLGFIALLLLWIKILIGEFFLIKIYVKNSIAIIADSIIKGELLLMHLGALKALAILLRDALGGIYFSFLCLRILYAKKLIGA